MITFKSSDNIVCCIACPSTLLVFCFQQQSCTSSLAYEGPRRTAEVHTYPKALIARVRASGWDKRTALLQQSLHLCSLEAWTGLQSGPKTRQKAVKKVTGYPFFAFTESLVLRTAVQSPLNDWH
jgi:hypothetical protein